MSEQATTGAVQVPTDTPVQPNDKYTSIEQIIAQQAQAVADAATNTLAQQAGNEPVAAPTESNVPSETQPTQAATQVEPPEWLATVQQMQSAMQAMQAELQALRHPATNPAAPATFDPQAFRDDPVGYLAEHGIAWDEAEAAATRAPDTNRFRRTVEQELGQAKKVLGEVATLRQEFAVQRQLIAGSERWPLLARHENGATAVAQEFLDSQRSGRPQSIEAISDAFESSLKAQADFEDFQKIRAEFDEFRKSKVPTTVSSPQKNVPVGNQPILQTSNGKGTGPAPQGAKNDAELFKQRYGRDGTPHEILNFILENPSLRF